MAVINAFAEDAVDRAEPLTVAAAYAQGRGAALAESAIGAVGLEIESHLVDLDLDLDHVPDPVPWKRVEAIAAVVGKVAPGTAVTVEPGGQIELSGPPEAGVAPAVARLRHERLAGAGRSPSRAGLRRSLPRGRPASSASVVSARSSAANRTNRARTTIRCRHPPAGLTVVVWFGHAAW